MSIDLICIHFQDKSGDYSSSTSVGIKNNITAQIIMSLYEVYILLLL